MSRINLMASQAMVSRVVMVYTLLISEAIQDRVPEMKDPQPEPPIYNILSTEPLVSCWSWRDHPELYSGSRHATEVNLQVACTLAGHIAWVPHIFRVVFMMRRTLRNLDSSRPSMLKVILGIRATSDWE